MKTCGKCQVIKDDTEFRVDKGRFCKPHAWCKNCEETYRQSDKSQSAKEANSRYLSTPKGRLMNQQKSRRRRETLTLTAREATLVVKRFNGKCFKCGGTRRLSIDHHYPLSRGHGLTFSNAVLLCGSCNSSKGMKPPEEFYTPEELSTLTKILEIPIDYSGDLV